MTVARRVAPNYTTQQPSEYKANLDAAAAVYARFGGPFAPHQVYSGSPQPDMALELDAGFLWDGVTLTEIAAQTVTGFTTPTSGQHRVDRVVIDAITGTASRVAGTATTGSPSATPPAIPAGKLPVCQVLLTSSDTTITNAMITDERVTRVAITAPRAIGRNIAAATGNFGSPTNPSSEINMSADELVLKDSSGAPYLASSVQVNAIITASGANGLDTGAEASSTWYYGWVIYNPTTGTLAGLLSTSSSAPTMPIGYTHKAMVTAVRNNGSSNFIAYMQKGRWAYYEAAQALLAGGTASSETSVDASALVPPNATRMQLSAGLVSTSGLDTSDLRVFSGSLAQRIASFSSGTASRISVVLLNILQRLYYINASVNGSLSLDVQAFELPIGGE